MTGSGRNREISFAALRDVFFLAQIGWSHRGGDERFNATVLPLPHFISRVQARLGGEQKFKLVVLNDESWRTLTSSEDVVLQEESFLDALPTDERLKKVRIIVVNVPCSKSGIVNPVDFILQEGVTNSIKELARGNTDSSKVGSLFVIVSDLNVN